MSSRAFTIAVLLFAPFVVLAPFIADGWMMTHSGSLNASWLEGFAAELAKGTFYPRYLPEMNEGLGSPVFYFYAPLPFFLTAPFVWFTGNGDLAVVLGSALLTGLSGLAAYALFRSHAEVRPSFAAALLYSFLPYHFATDVMIRGAYGETAAFIFLPLALHFLLRLEQGPRAAAGLALSVAGLLLSHLPSSLAMLPVLALFGAGEIIRTRSIALALRGLAAAACGAALAAVYILPAFAGQRFIRPEFWNAFAPETDTFWRFRNGGDYLLLVQGVMAFVVAGLTLKTLWPAIPQLRWPIAVTLAAILVLATPLGQPLWPWLGPLRRIQFSWRLFAVLDLMACWLIAMAPRGRILPLAVLSTLIIAAIYQQAFTAVPGRPSLFQPPLETYASERALRADAFEYVPPCATITEDLYGFMTSDEKLVRKLQDEAAGGDRLRRFHYPFLRVTGDGSTPLATRCEAGTGLLLAEGLAGRRATITMVPLAAERAGLLLALLGVAGVLLMLLMSGVRRAAGLRGVTVTIGQQGDSANES